MGDNCQSVSLQLNYSSASNPGLLLSSQNYRVIYPAAQDKVHSITGDSQLQGALTVASPAFVLKLLILFLK